MKNIIINIQNRTYKTLKYGKYKKALKFSHQYNKYFLHFGLKYTNNLNFLCFKKDMDKYQIIHTENKGFIMQRIKRTRMLCNHSYN